MAITRVQSTGKVTYTPGHGTPVPLVFGSAVTAVSLIIVQIAMWKNDNNPSVTVSDTQGNTYALAALSSANNNSRAAIYYTFNAAAGSTTVNLAVLGQYTTAVATEWSGFGTSDPLDVAATNTGSSTTPSTGTTSTTAEASAVAAAVFGVSATQGSIAVETVSPAWTQEFEELLFSFEPGEADTRILTATGTQACSWTIDVSGTWAGAIAVFSPAAPLPPTRLTQQGRQTAWATNAPAARLTFMGRQVAYTFTCEVSPPGGGGTTPQSGQRGIYVPTRGVGGAEGGGTAARFSDLSGRIIPVLKQHRVIYVPPIPRVIDVYDGEGYTHR